MPHIFKITKQLINEEFPLIKKQIYRREIHGNKIKEWLNLLMGDMLPGKGYENTFAFIEWHQSAPPTVVLVLHKIWLELDDEGIKNILRHEFLHWETGKGDLDIEFIEEALERGMILNDKSEKILYAYRIDKLENQHFNRKLFDVFIGNFEYWANFLNLSFKGGQ